MAMFLSIFGQRMPPGWFYCSNFQGNFKTTLELFGYGLSISCIWNESSARRFLSAAFIENSKSYRSGIKNSTSYSRKLEESFAEISWDTFENYKRLQHRCFSVNIAKFSRRWLLLNFFIESQKETVFTTNGSVMRTLNVLSQLILHLICQDDAQNVQHSQKQFFFSVDFLVVIIIYRYFLFVYL